MAGTARHAREEDEPKQEEHETKQEEHETIRAARIARRGVLIQAAIGASAVVVAALITGFLTIAFNSAHRDHSNGASTTPEATLEKPTSNGTTPNGTIDGVTVSDDRTQVTVIGRTTAHAVAVLVGPRPGSYTEYWASGVTITSAPATGLSEGDNAWRVIVQTDPRLPDTYRVKAYFDSRSVGFVPPPVSPLDLAQDTVKAAIRCGDGCLGPPAVYQNGS
jgi:hypothetical protein